MKTQCGINRLAQWVVGGSFPQTDILGTSLGPGWRSGIKIPSVFMCRKTVPGVRGKLQMVQVTTKSRSLPQAPVRTIAHSCSGSFNVLVLFWFVHMVHTKAFVYKFVNTQHQRCRMRTFPMHKTVNSTKNCNRFTLAGELSHKGTKVSFSGLRQLKKSHRRILSQMNCAWETIFFWNLAQGDFDSQGCSVHQVQLFFFFGLFRATISSSEYLLSWFPRLSCHLPHRVRKWTTQFSYFHALSESDSRCKIPTQIHTSSSWSLLMETPKDSINQNMRADLWVASLAGANFAVCWLSASFAVAVAYLSLARRHFPLEKKSIRLHFSWITPLHAFTSKEESFFNLTLAVNILNSFRVGFLGWTGKYLHSLRQGLGFSFLFKDDFLNILYLLRGKTEKALTLSQFHRENAPNQKLPRGKPLLSEWSLHSPWGNIHLRIDIFCFSFLVWKRVASTIVGAKGNQGFWFQ